MSWFTNSFAEEIWRTKYAGEFEDIEKYYRALAKRIAQNSEEEEEFFSILWEKRFSPAGRILAFNGRPNARMSLMNCTTHAIQGDSLEAISDAGYKIMRASSRGQGIGIDLSALRPRGAPVNNAAKTSTGSISFMELLNHIGITIGQEGRRAALLFSLRIDHPDIWTSDGYDFLNIKKQPGKVENANISVLITDEFMHAVEEGNGWTPKFIGDSGEEEFSLASKITATELFEKIAQSAWESAEPGLLMWDTSKKFSNSDLLGYPIVGVNACTEQILDHEGVCNLGSINLMAYVSDPFTEEALFDFVKFEHDIDTAIRFLDNVLDIELQARGSISEQQRQSIIDLRRIGLGVMGLADTLSALLFVYAWNPITIEFTQKIFETLRDRAYWTSVDLAIEKGPAPAWKGHSVVGAMGEAFFATLPDILKEAIVRAGGTRNVTLLSVAPTGSISNLLGVSSGIEPLFAHEYTRRTRINGKDEFIEYIHPGVVQSRALGVPDDIWNTSYDIDPMDHIHIQGLAQRYIDQSISKTVNLSKDATVEDVLDVYMEAWKFGLKGITIYRDSSREEQILYQGKIEVCPECGNGIIYRDGCKECSSCSWSICEI
jgi:ribonucleoside-diphosphate reductase alpha chain